VNWFVPPLQNATGALSASQGIEMTGYSIAERRLKWYEATFRREQHRCRTLRNQVQELTVTKEDLENLLRNGLSHEDSEQCRRETAFHDSTFHYSCIARKITEGSCNESMNRAAGT
jgi:hypothetical protein